MFELIKSVKSMLEASSAIDPGESALVITSNQGGPIWLGQIIAAAVESLGAKPVSLVMPPLPGARWEFAKQEPPAPVAASFTGPGCSARFPGSSSAATVRAPTGTHA